MHESTVTRGFAQVSGKIPAPWSGTGRTFFNAYRFGTLLYDLQADPEQHAPLVDDAVELRMAGLLVDLMRANDAPASQYERLDLPADGPVTEAHLLVRG